MADDAVVSTGRIGVVLPSRETFTLARSGAVALCARDFARFSRFAGRIDILGAGPCEYADVSYRRLRDWRRWWRRDRHAYAQAVADAAAGYGLLEVQNRPYMMAALRRRRPGLRLALHLHNDPQDMDGSRTPSERSRLLELCDSVYCVSDFIRRRFLANVADTGEKTSTILNGAPAPKLVGEKAPIVAFTGRVVAIKGVAELVRAFAAADPEGWRLVIAGSDPDRLLDGLSRERERLGERFEWRGQISHAEAMALLAQAAVAAVPSMWDDPCPRAAIEALTHGCALVTSRRGGLPEIGEGAALFVDPANASGFAAALRRLAQDEAFRSDLQARATARAAASFEIGEATARLDRARARLIGEP
jgi:glycosyltransferase involved in cell wall biosynthesis